jgi:GNAT superfamily N-acetyltransferase
VIKVKPVNSRKEFKAFLDLPDKLYKDDKNWVPKLDMDVKHLLSDKNPFYQHAWKQLFLAYNGKEVVGRIAAIVDRKYIEFQEEKTGFFGFFECIDDREVAAALFNACVNVLKEKGMENILGPMNPSSNDECGLLIEGFDSPPRIMMPYNPQYYMTLIEDCGLSKARDLLALHMDVMGYDKMRLEGFVKRITKRNPQLSARPINLKDFRGEVENIKEIYNNAWVKNWGFVPWTDAQLEDIAGQLKPLVVPELVWIGCWEDKPIGFLMVLPDYNMAIKEIGRKLLPFGWIKFLQAKKKLRESRLMAMGVMSEYQNKGIGALMYYNALETHRQKGYTSTEFSWILEDNVETLRIGDLMGASVYKKYRVYQKSLF